MSSQREQFSSKLGFILAAAGSAVGIGNLVAFPVKATQSGGAAFLVVYIAFIALICLPVMIAEMALGRHTQRNPIGAFDAGFQKSSLFWRIGGWLAVVTPFMIAVFYQVITVWIFGYFFGAVTGQLDVMSEPGYFGQFINSNGVFAYLAVFTVLIGLIINGGVQKGVERLSRILMPTLLLMLILLVAFVLTLDNALLGAKYYLVPDFSKISPKVISNALNHAFFSLSLGMGILITYGSYLNKQESITKSAKMTALLDTSVAFLAGLLILPAIFAFNPQTNAQELSTSSVSLVFTFLPKIFLSLQNTVGYVGASFFASMFFLLVFFAALTSQVSILQVPLSALQDQLKYSRTKSVLVLGGLATVFVIACTLSFGRIEFLATFTEYAGQTKSFFDVVVDLFYDTVLPLNGLIVCLFVMLRWKKSGINAELAQGDDGFVGSMMKKYINTALTTFIPLILLLVFINTVCLKFFGLSLI